MMWYWSDGTPWWGWILMCVGMLAFWAVVIGAIFYAITHTTRGDIDRDEYATRRTAWGSFTGPHVTGHRR